MCVLTFFGEKILFVLLRSGARRARAGRRRRRPVGPGGARGVIACRAVEVVCLYFSFYERDCLLHAHAISYGCVQLDTRAHSPRISPLTRDETPRDTTRHACGTHVPRKRTTKVQSSRCHVHNHPEVSGRLWIDGSAPWPMLLRKKAYLISRERLVNLPQDCTRDVPRLVKASSQPALSRSR